MKMKREACNLLSHSKMKFLGGFWNFHVWNPKPLLFMLDFIRQSLGLGGIDTWFVWFEYVQTLFINLNMLTIWHKKTICALVFDFLFFSECLCPFESWSNPRFDQDLNKYRTWKWKWKPVSFLVTLKWSFWEVFEISMFETQNHLSSCLTKIWPRFKQV